MKITAFLLISAIISNSVFAQDSLWIKKVINPLLTMRLPAKFEHAQISYVKGYGGEIKENYYGFQYYDTVTMKIETEEQFQISLAGFMTGKMEDSTLKRYSYTFFDTSFGGSKGIMTRFKTIDNTEFYQQIYYYVTLINSKYYSFYAYTPLKGKDEELNYYFNSISFDTSNIKENSFVNTALWK